METPKRAVVKSAVRADQDEEFTAVKKPNTLFGIPSGIVVTVVVFSVIALSVASVVLVFAIPFATVKTNAIRNQAEDKPAFTSDKTILAFKDNPQQFKGQTLTVKAQIGKVEQFGEPKFLNRTYFTITAKAGDAYNSPTFDVKILVDCTKLQNRQSLDPGDKVDLEFICNDGELMINNVATKLSRSTN